MAAATAVGAADRAAAGGDAAVESASAKIVVGQAATSAASTAHQVHGAIGFTYEHALHYATRRLWSWRAEFGAESHWAELLGRAAIRRGADRLWPDLTARQAGLNRISRPCLRGCRFSRTMTQKIGRGVCRERGCQ